MLGVASYDLLGFWKIGEAQFYLSALVFEFLPDITRVFSAKVLSASLSVVLEELMDEIGMGVVVAN
ncbi:hypothetical protein E2562_023052 [Oryza meyeriana var. granulata]|uniref:Uncharacterized protein n=1 Tax=Oryza meyeriana var. granulata TaxID=110450 RepID=A0A6G1EYN8_9ORYZ|nr:hypothetical protein E2562_023052 [Oryza meyeriana var. granulata]